MYGPLLLGVGPDLGPKQCETAVEYLKRLLQGSNREQVRWTAQVCRTSARVISVGEGLQPGKRGRLALFRKIACIWQYTFDDF